MKARIFVTSALLALMTSAASATTTYSPVFVESNGHRPDAQGDISGIRDIGQIDAGQNIGIAGRIVTAVDRWSFQTVSDWSISLVDLDIDDNRGFDSSNIEDPAGDYADNGDTTTAIFSIFDADGDNDLLYSSTLTANLDGLMEGIDFSSGAGNFLLVIDGQARSPGATYDLGIATVPLPAGSLLLLSGLAGLGIARGRKSKT